MSQISGLVECGGRPLTENSPLAEQRKVVAVAGCGLVHGNTATLANDFRRWMERVAGWLEWVPTVPELASTDTGQPTNSVKHMLSSCTKYIVHISTYVSCITCM